MASQPCPPVMKRLAGFINLELGTDYNYICIVMPKANDPEFHYQAGMIANDNLPTSLAIQMLQGALANASSPPGERI